MAFTRSWEETKPTGTEDAKLGDDRIRNLKVELGERLEDMLYGFNASDTTGHEALYGIKKLRFRELASDPTIIDTDNEVFFYAKNVSDISEIFWKDNTDTVRQLTNDGKINVLDADGAVMKTGDQTIAGVKTLASPVINTAISGSAVLDEDNMASDSATHVATQQSIKKYVNDQIAAGADPTYSGGESHTFDGGLIIKMGYIARSGTTTTVTFGTAFPDTLISVQATAKSTASQGVYFPAIDNPAKTGFEVKSDTGVTGYYWTAIGH